MSDSKKLPIIEIGDTVVFRTDLEEWRMYGSYMFNHDMIRHSRHGGVVKRLSHTGSFCIGVGYWFPSESVAEVIKPTKERVYSDIELREAIQLARGFRMTEHLSLNQIIKQLNSKQNE